MVLIKLKHNVFLEMDEVSKTVQQMKIKQEANLDLKLIFDALEEAIILI